MFTTDEKNCITADGIPMKKIHFTYIMHRRSTVGKVEPHSLILPKWRYASGPGGSIKKSYIPDFGIVVEKISIRGGKFLFVYSNFPHKSSNNVLQFQLISAHGRIPFNLVSKYRVHLVVHQCCGQLWVWHIICGQTCDGLYHFAFYISILAVKLSLSAIFTHRWTATTI